jgi:hypothetical protein
MSWASQLSLSSLSLCHWTANAGPTGQPGEQEQLALYRCQCGDISQRRGHQAFIRYMTTTGHHGKRE